MEFVGLKAQHARLKANLAARLAGVFARCQFIMGAEVPELEQLLAARTGSEHCIACSSGTDALLLALMALGIGRGDEVVTTPLSFAATADTIAFLEATPVFVDIDPLTWNLDHRLLRSAISPRTRAIMPVSLFGQCADMDAINLIAAEYLLPVIEDAAQSFGATYKGRASCNLSTIGCTSFFPSKPLGCYGDGGACFTNDDELAARMRQIRVHGQDRRYHHVCVGINGRLDTLQAAVLLAKLDIFDDELMARARVAGCYNRLLQDVVRTPFIEPHNTSAFAQYTIEVEDRDAFERQLKSEGIPTAVHYPLPLHLQPAFRHVDAQEGNLPWAEAAARHVISLPMHPYLAEQDQLRISEAVCKAALQSAGV